MTITTCSYCEKIFDQKNFHKKSKNHFCCKKCETEFKKGKSTKWSKKYNRIRIEKDYAIIEISNNILGKFDCLIDIEDIEKIKEYYWNARVDRRHLDLIPYIETHKNKKRLHLHRLIMNCPDDKIVDHINGNNLDNRKQNLRICTQAINCQNKHNAKNIYYNKRDDLYYVVFKINGKRKSLCYTRNYQEAEYYAKLGRKLILTNNLEKLFNMPCKKIEIQKNNSSGYTGISKLKNGKYQVCYKKKYLATANNIEEAYKLQQDYISQLEKTV